MPYNNNYDNAISGQNPGAIYGGQADPYKAAQEQHAGGMAKAAIGTGQLRNIQGLVGMELYDGPQVAHQYAQGADQLAQARLQQGMHQANAGMAAQAASRGSNPLAMRNAISQGGRNSMQAANMGAQLSGQGMMQASQIALQQRGQNLGALDSLQGHNMTARSIKSQEQMAQAELDQQSKEADRAFGMQLGGAGASALGTMMSDVRAKEQIAPIGGSMSPGTAPMTSIGQSGGGHLGTRQYYLGSEGGSLQGLPMADNAGSGFAGEVPMMGGMSQFGGALGAAGQQLMGSGDLRPSGSPMVSDAHAKQNAYALGQRDAAAQLLGHQLDAEGAGMTERLNRAGMSQPDQQALDIYDQLEREDDKTMRSLNGYSYEYTPEAQQQLGQPPGRQFGPMAQEMAQTEMGRGMLTQSPDGTLAIDRDAALKSNLAMTGRLAERLDALEGKPQYGRELVGPPDAEGDILSQARQIRARENPWGTNDIGDPVTMSDGTPSHDGALLTARHNMRPLSPEEEREMAMRESARLAGGR